MKANVLPEPVGDFASTSRPARTSPITFVWMANGASKPRSASAFWTARDTPRSAKDGCDMQTPMGTGAGLTRVIREAVLSRTAADGGTQGS